MVSVFAQVNYRRFVTIFRCRAFGFFFSHRNFPNNLYSHSALRIFWICFTRIPWSHSCHHLLVLETKINASSEQRFTSCNLYNRILIQFQLCWGQLCLSHAPEPVPEVHFLFFPFIHGGDKMRAWSDFTTYSMKNGQNVAGKITKPQKQTKDMLKQREPIRTAAFPAVFSSFLDHLSPRTDMRRNVA